MRGGRTGLRLWLAVTVLGSLIAVFWFAPVTTVRDHAMHMAGATPSPEALGSRPATRVKLVSCEQLPNVPGKSLTTAWFIFRRTAFRHDTVTPAP
jgi:hypothetical protein